MSNNTLADIRQEVFDELLWDPNPAQSAVTRINRRIGAAVRELANEAPSGLYEQTDSIELEPDVESASDDDLVAPLKATDYEADSFPSGDRANAWVFRTVYQSQALTGATVDWDTERGWDGRLVELTNDAGETFWNQIRTVWEVDITRDPVPSGKDPSVPATWSEFRFSLVRPWNTDLGAGPFRWRVVTPSYAFPSQILRLSSLYLHGRKLELDLVSQDEVERLSQDSRTPTSAQGTPRYAYRREAARLEAPESAPDVAFSDSEYWLGPEPFGRFSYTLTYTWGKLGREGNAPGMSYFDAGADPFSVSSSMTVRTTGTNRSRKCRWESAPSPESGQIEVAFVPGLEEGEFTRAKAVEVTLPNIEYVLGFMMAGAQDAGTFERASIARSGIHVRIYRTRWTEDYDQYDQLGVTYPGQHVSSLRKMDIRPEPQLLAEIRIDPSNEGVFVDDGTILPDRAVQPSSQGVYPSIALYPRPDEVDRLDVRHIRVPKIPVLDREVMPVTDTGWRVIVHKVIAKEAGPDDVNLAQMHRRLANEATLLLNKTVDLTPGDQVIKRRPAKAGRRGRALNNSWWR